MVLFHLKYQDFFLIIYSLLLKYVGTYKHDHGVGKLIAKIGLTIQSGSGEVLMIALPPATLTLLCNLGIQISYEGPYILNKHGNRNRGVSHNGPLFH